MKRNKVAVILFGLILTVAGCGSHNVGNSTVNGENAVSEMTNDQIESSSAETAETNENINRQGAEGVDYDLTVMNSEMVYALVYQMMADPDSYVGKTIRIEGRYSASYYEATEQYYFFCMIEDAAACCAQGLEFVWGDGSHVYPDEYPEDNSEVIVQGIFETYEEDGKLYCRLRDAVLE